MESSPSLSGSSKRAKAPGNVAQVAHCLVDGCNSDLSRCREYHRRHKVCEIHSKTPKVTIGGREQRFCQQCSRFHSLAEFDEVKRSCRKRLDGHNRRRRKPQPDTLSKSSGMVFSSQQGSKLVSFSSSQIFPTTTSGVSSTIWPPGFFNNNSQHLNYKGEMNQFQFIQGSSEFEGISSISQPLDSDHHRALSLLSSASSSVNREIGPGLMSRHVAVVHPEPQSLVHGLHYGGPSPSPSPYPFAQEIESKDLINFHNVMQNAPTNDGSSTSCGPQQTHTFLWEQAG